MSAFKMSRFETEWEEFRLQNDINQEEFVAVGYGFVEKLEEFIKLQNKDLEDALSQQEEIVSKLRDGYVMQVKAREELEKELGIAKTALKVCEHIMSENEADIAMEKAKEALKQISE
jgi:hypothetical protein